MLKANNRDVNYKDKSSSYINDNLARKAYVNTSPVHKEKEDEKVKRVERTVTEKQPRRMFGASVGFAFAALMMVAVAVVFQVVISFINLNIDASSKAKQVASLRKQVQTATMENDNYEMSINSSIDYNTIYNIATQELGMVYASNNQIVTYTPADSEFVVQYKDIK